MTPTHQKIVGTGPTGGFFGQNWLFPHFLDMILDNKIGIMISGIEDLTMLNISLYYT